MEHVADRLDQAADALTALAREVPQLQAAPGAFAALPPVSVAGTVSGSPGGGGAAGRGVAHILGAGGPDGGVPGRRIAGSADGEAAEGAGLPGRVGRALHDHWAAVLEARSHEASAAAARLTAMAGSVRAARRDYTGTDEAVRRRFTREM